MQNVIKLLVLSFIVSAGLYASQSKLSTSVSLQTMSMDYREYLPSGKILDSEKSNFHELGGVEVGVDYLLVSSARSTLELNSNLNFLGGYTDYVGSLRGTRGEYGSVLSRTVDYIFDFDIALQNKYKLMKNVELTYALGLGYRFWKRMLSENQAEDYKWFSLRPMLGINYQVMDKIMCGLEVQYEHGLDTIMYASDTGSTYDLASANILKYSFAVMYDYSDAINILFKYIYEKQEIEASNIINGFYEPQSTAKNQYLKIGLDFKF